jgi:hypothetical protein
MNYAINSFCAVVRLNSGPVQSPEAHLIRVKQ